MPTPGGALGARLCPAAHQDTPSCHAHTTVLVPSLVSQLRWTCLYQLGPAVAYATGDQPSLGPNCHRWLDTTTYDDTRPRAEHPRSHAIHRRLRLCAAAASEAAAARANRRKADKCALIATQCMNEYRMYHGHM